MAREPETYRLELEAIYEFFGKKAILTQREVIEYTGHQSRWVKEKLGVGADGITAVSLAMNMSTLGKPGRKLKV